MQMKPLITSQKGFTLTELLISTGILMTLIAMLTSQLFSFNRTAAETNIRQDMESELRTTLRRLEKEMMPAAQLLKEHPDDSSLVTNKNRIILKVPAFDQEGMVNYTDATGRSTANLLIISKEEDPNGETLKRNGAPKNHRLRLWLERPNSTSTRQEIEGQTIAKNLMPSANDGNYALPGSISNPEAIGTFTFYTAAGNEETVADNYKDNVALIKVVLWAEKNTSKGSINTRKEIEIRLRNYQQNPTTDL